jgi:predicted lactoylglutathione lyase
MIGYVTLGVSDIQRARRFYDALFGTVGAVQLMALEENGFTMYGSAWDKPCVVITKPYDGGPASPGNGNMVALAMNSREQVDAFYAKALEIGGSSEGEPGVREPAEMGFYGAYFRDPDGNKFCAFKLGRAA